MIVKKNKVKLNVGIFSVTKRHHIYTCKAVNEWLCSGIAFVYSGLINVY